MIFHTNFRTSKILNTKFLDIQKFGWKINKKGAKNYSISKRSLYFQSFHKFLDNQKFGWKINKKGDQKLQHFEKEFVFSKNFDQTFSRTDRIDNYLNLLEQSTNHLIYTSLLYLWLERALRALASSSGGAAWHGCRGVGVRGQPQGSGDDPKVI